MMFRAPPPPPPPPAPPPPPPPPPPAFPALKLPEEIARYLPKKVPTLPELPSFPSLSFSAAALLVPAGASSLRRSLARATATATAKLRPAVESCAAAVSEVSAAFRKNGIEALDAARPALRNLEAAAKSLEHSLKTALASSSSSSFKSLKSAFAPLLPSLKALIETSSEAFSSSHAALRRITGRTGPQAKLWFQ